MKYDHEFISEIIDSFIDIIPAAVLVTDEDRKIYMVNKPRDEIFTLHEPDGDEQDEWRMGDTLNCIHRNDSPEGCGFGPSCEDCSVRRAADEALSGGKVIRKKGAFTQEIEDKTVYFSILISAVPAVVNSRKYAVILVENISDVEALAGLLPICANCKKIRTEDGTWERIDRYLESKVSVLFTHGICGECAEQVYGYSELSRKRDSDDTERT